MTQISGNLLKVISSNLLVVAANIASGFIVPKIFTIDEYAIRASFTLYLSFVGILHIGYVDGIHLKYGGYALSKIPKNEIKAELYFLALFQFLISVLFLLGALLSGEKILVPVACSILPINLITFFLFFFQATSQFNLYSLVNLAHPFFRLAVIFMMLFFVQFRSPYVLIWSQVVITWGIFLFLIYLSAERLKGVRTVSVFSRQHIQLIRTGIFILGGNLLAILFFSFDRWFVKLFLTTQDFAFYSFAVAMMSLVMLFVQSVALVFYPLLVTNKENEFLISKLRDSLLIVGAYSCASFFVFKLVIMNFLQKYEPSISIIAVTFAGFPAIAVVKSLYVNLFKAHKEERNYFRRATTMAIFALSLNVIAVLFWKTTVAIATATTISFYTWFIVSAKDYRGISLGARHFILLGLFLSLFYCSVQLVRNTFLGFGFYVSVLTILFFFFMKDSFYWLVYKTFAPVWQKVRPGGA